MYCQSIYASMHDGHTNSLPNPIGGAIGDRIVELHGANSFI
jgi:hypothetical protein